ncbi:MAG: hypothetical protein EA341_17115 [Mongoliibacter sp.]|uniref:hypothetical protein n=1 Tax=Mongoliibacter sp. TaxID=2022438 RepID=UPI0012F15F09|nr:hypothetical protein [Mongoliibacter sp.]TVP44135.1 MAG: hypothetical protein EA341_17115 [Mongoliibacter sp.]
MSKNLNTYILSLLLMISISACSLKVDLDGMDLEAWKKDRNGCLGLREPQIDAFRLVKNELLGKDNQALLKTFGKPDRVELADRSQNFFIYYVEPSPDCDSEDLKSDPIKVIFRLNAMSRVSEVTISTLDP